MNYGMIDAEIYRAQAASIRRADRLVAIVAAWHRDVHKGSFVTCQDQPCLPINLERVESDTGSEAGL